MFGCSRGENFKFNTVSGTVTMNGQPLPGVLVSFYPSQSGPASAGVTDSSGKFNLHDRDGTPGAVAGEHSVMIITAPTESGAPAKETILPKYNTETELKETVKEGPNEFTFALTGPAKKK